MEAQGRSCREVWRILLHDTLLLVAITSASGSTFETCRRSAIMSACGFRLEASCTVKARGWPEGDMPLVDAVADFGFPGAHMRMLPERSRCRNADVRTRRSAA